MFGDGEAYQRQLDRIAGVLDSDDEDALPTAGSPVFERGPDGEPANPVGTVTSSTLSPMLGAASVRPDSAVLTAR